MNLAGAPAILATGMVVPFQLNSKRLIHSRDRAGEYHRTARRALFLHLEVVFLCEFFNTGNIGGIGAMLLSKLLTRIKLSFFNRLGEFLGIDNRFLARA